MSLVHAALDGDTVLVSMLLSSASAEVFDQLPGRVWRHPALLSGAQWACGRHKAAD